MTFHLRAASTVSVLACVAFAGCMPGSGFGGAAASLASLGDDPSYVPPTDPFGPADDDDATDPFNGFPMGPTWDPDFNDAVRGYVHSTSGEPLQGVVIVSRGTIVDTTDAGGRWSIPNQQMGEERTYAFMKAGYGTSWSSFTPVEGGINYFSQPMAEVDVMTTFEAGQGFDATVDGSHSFSIPSGTILDQDGEEYDGQVNLELTVWERETDLDQGGELLASPGDGQGQADDGNDYLLYTFGMFQVVMTDDDGNALLPGEGFQATVDVPEDSNLEQGDEVPSWSLDTQQNTWVEQEPGVITDLPGGGQVWEFTPTQGLGQDETTTEIISQTLLPPAVTKNPDYQLQIITEEQTGTASGVVRAPDGEPVAGAEVRVVAEDQTYMAQTTTDGNGAFQVTVPPRVDVPQGPNGRAVFVEVDYAVGDHPYLWRSDPIPPPEVDSDTSFGDIRTGSPTCLAGTVVDDAGNGIEGMQVAASHGGNAVTDSEGGFCMQLPKWQPATVYAVPVPDQALAFEPARIRPADVATGGSCDQVCPNQVVLRPYADSACATGTVTVNGDAGEVQVDAFDTRYPSAPIASTLARDGNYDLQIPAGTSVTLRVGAGDLHADNQCATLTVGPQSEGQCADVPQLICE